MQSIEELLSRPHEVLVADYKLSHRLLILVLHSGNPRDGHQVVCGRTRRFCGPMELSQQTLHLSIRFDPSLGESVYTLANVDGSFSVECLAVNLVRENYFS
jgi:hypothetical protein